MDVYANAYAHSNVHACKQVDMQVNTHAQTQTNLAHSIEASTAIIAKKECSQLVRHRSVWAIMPCHAI